MPTTRIEMPVRDQEFERRVAKELSFWWRRHGADIRHVITRFQTLDCDRVYSGPYPMSGQPEASRAPFAFVSCVLSQSRDVTFKTEYARQVRSSLAARIPANRVLVSFYPVNPADHFAPGEPSGEPEEA